MKLAVFAIGFAAVVGTLITSPAQAQKHRGVLTRLNTCDLYARQPAAYPHCHFQAFPLCVDSRPCRFNGKAASVCLRYECINIPTTGPGGVPSLFR